MLICAAPFGAASIGGLQDALGDLAAGLEARGWRVELLARRPERDPPGREIPATRRAAIERAVSVAFPPAGSMSRIVRRLAGDIRGGAAASEWLHEVERRITTGSFDVVVGCLDVAPIGLSRVLVRSAARHVLVSLVALTRELKYRSALPALRSAARPFAGRRMHPDLYRAVDAAMIAGVVFPSGTWMKEAIRAGVPPDVARVIHFGVALPARPTPCAPVRSPARLLWAGRLSPEKGLHLFLDALPRVAAVRPVRLTVFAAPGPPRYARLVENTIARLRLQSIVDVRTVVPRAQLAAEYANHDLLLFHSVFAEPVAQVLLAAAAAGLPVVGPASCDGGLLADDTAVCYRTTTPEAVASAILRCLDSPDWLPRAARLEQRVRRDHDLVDTVSA